MSEAFVFNKPLGLRRMIGGLFHHGASELIRNRSRVDLVWDDSQRFLGIPDGVIFGSYVNGRSASDDFDTKY
jgi:hypothetical protein